MTAISLLPLDNVFARIRHAEEYLDTLQNQVKAWMDKDPYTIVNQANADFTRYSLILLVKEEPALQKWTLISSDIIHSLRCSLDYMIYAIAAYESRQEIPPNFGSLQFPIYNSSKQFRKNKWRIETLIDTIRKQIGVDRGALIKIWLHDG